MSNETNYREILSDNESLAIFLRAMSKFDGYFCAAMVGGEDFNLRIEVKGNQGELIHCRVVNDGFERPKAVEKKILEKLMRYQKHG